MDGWMDGWINGWTDGRTDGRAGEQTDGRMDVFRLINSSSSCFKSNYFYVIVFF